jgi:hypothetical protein
VILRQARRRGATADRNAERKAPATRADSGKFLGRTLARTISAGADGIAAFPHAQEVAGPPREARVISVAVDTLLEFEISKELEEGRIPAEPLTLQLPPTGELEVVLLDSEGQPLLDEKLVIALSDIVPRRSGFSSMAAFSNPTPAPDGRARFRYLGLGRKFRASALREWLGPPLTGEIDGPTEPGARVRLTMMLPMPDRTVRARILDEEGEPAVDAEVTVEIRMETGRESFRGYERRETDGAGSLELLLAPELVERRGACHLWLTRRDPEGKPLGSAILELPDELPPGVTDLGDVTLSQD